MGHQINYYLTPTDLDNALNRIVKCGEFEILHARSYESAPRILPTANHQEDGKRWLFLYIARRDCLSEIKMDKVPNQNYWTVDDLRSPVVQLDAGFFDGKNLRRGRVYYVKSFFDEADQKIVKSLVFLEWAKCVFANLKKTLQFDPDRHVYIGEDALFLATHQNGKLLGPFE